MNGILFSQIDKYENENKELSSQEKVSQEMVSNLRNQIGKLSLC